MLMIFGLALILVGGYLWWQSRPLTARQLFETRCAACHELKRELICEYDPLLRGQIVEVMRRTHGADEVINERESEVIRDFLVRGMLCQR